MYMFIGFCETFGLCKNLGIARTSELPKFGCTCTHAFDERSNILIKFCLFVCHRLEVCDYTGVEMFCIKTFIVASATGN